MSDDMTDVITALKLALDDGTSAIQFNRKVAKRILAALGPQWRPIASAPTDIREHFLVGAVGHRVMMASGHRDNDWRSWARLEGFYPTHWMPAPGAPMVGT